MGGWLKAVPLCAGTGRDRKPGLDTGTTERVSSPLPKGEGYGFELERLHEWVAVRGLRRVDAGAKLDSRGILVALIPPARGRRYNMSPVELCKVGEEAYVASNSE